MTPAMITWENVYIFISSTFNDMHAERDYLIKRVFPALREFCAEHKLNLLDVDLRWGITEEDAAKNKRVVEICLNNLDRCRPFFIGLLGQRRGWVPGPSDIRPETLEMFPGLAQYLGKTSITELELIHGIRHPLADGRERMRHAFLLKRDPSYLAAISDERIRAVYDDRPVPAKPKGLFSRLSRRLSPDRQPLTETDRLLTSPGADSTVSVHRYIADWDAQARTPELSSVGGQDLSAGRLKGFRMADGTGNVSLSDYLIDALKEAIREEFPAHFEERAEETPLMRELSRQETALFHAAGLYIARPDEEKKIFDYVHGDNAVPLLLTADAGSGKTSLLSHVISSLQKEQTPLFFRLAGAYAESSSASATIESLCTEIASAGYADEAEVKEHRYEILLYFREFLAHTKPEPIRIIIDAVDQWSEFARDTMEWFPETLPSHVRLVISMKTEGSGQQALSLRERGVQAVSMMPFSAEKDKRELIRSFLAAFLKDINEDEIRRLTAMKGSDNPLYLKIILNELRLHGSFDTLFAQLEKNYGTTPKDAFGQLINRLLQETLIDEADSRSLTVYFLGILAFAEEPVPFRDISEVLLLTPELGKTLSRTQILDGLYIVARHLSDFLMIDGGSAAFRYDSFRQAFRERVDSQNREIFHHLLCTIYVYRSRRGGDRHYRDADRNCLTAIARHGVSAGEEIAAAVLTDAWFVSRLVSEAGALNASHWFREAEHNGCTGHGYGRMADFLARHASRCDIGVNPLFYSAYLEEPDLPLMKRLYDRSREEMKLPFYYPAEESAKEALAPEKEITLVRAGRFNEYKLFYYKDRILQYSTHSSEIVVQSRDSGAVLKRVPLRKDVQHCYPEKDYFHVLYATGFKGRGAAETFHLPDFSSVFYTEEHPELSDEYKWSNFIFGSDGQYYEEACKDGLNAGTRLYQLNSGQMVISSEFSPENETFTSGILHQEYCGNCLVEYYFSVNAALPSDSPDHFSPEQIRLWHIPGRQRFHESQDLHYLSVTTDGERIWLLCLDLEHRVRCLVWKETDRGMEPLLDMPLPLPGTDIAAVSAYDGILCVFFKHGLMMSFDRNLAPLRKVPGCDLVPTEPWYCTDYNRLMRMYKGQVAFVHKNRLCFFDRAAFERADVSHRESIFPESASRRSLQMLPRENSLLLLSDVIRRIDLSSMRCVAETDTEMEAFRYITHQTWRLEYLDVVFGTLCRSGRYYIQAVSCSLAKPVLRYGMDLPENSSRVPAVFAMKNRVGAILEICYDGDPRTKHSAYEFEIQFCDYSDGIRLSSRIRLPGRSDVLEMPLVCRDGERFLIARTELLLDEDHRGVSLYDVEMQEEIPLMQYETKGHYHILSDMEEPRMFCRDGELYLPMIIYRDKAKEGTNTMFAFDLHTGKQRSYELPPGKCRGLDEDLIYLLDDGIFKNGIFTDPRDPQRTVSVCRIRDGQVPVSFKLRHREFVLYIMKKNNDFLVFLDNDILEVFDASDGTYRYSQYLSSEYIVDCPGTEYFYAGDQKRRHALYRRIDLP